MLYYQDGYSTLIQGDTFDILSTLEPGSFDMIFADPPYFLSNGGITCSGGKQASVNKGYWDEGLSLEDKHSFNRSWLRLCRKLLTKQGTIWVSGTFHNIYSVGMALEQENYKILNNITWRKTNPPPNLACRSFTHSTETILWAKPNEKDAKHIFNYNLMKDINNGKQMKDLWEGPLTKKSEKKFGKHPTQKPSYLLERIILSSTNSDSLILDPFVGSGTTCVVAKKIGRKSVGIDQSSEYLEIAAQRLKEMQ